ncbi:CHRD domain-containing protein [Sphingomonas sp. GCM10030256]|uniref:CHRD domain-containing protein n=1 Tax=Sphingomonas sp. GCM10030256 TaxID=3273427 RepID=UPI003610F4A3
MALKTFAYATFMSAVLTGVALSAPVAEGGRKFTTELTGEAEVNAQGVPNQGDLDGTGTAQVTLNPGQGRVCWDITVSGIAAPTRGHIHEAPTGQNGAIAVGFFEANNVALSGCTDVDRAQIKEIIKRPQDYYVNIHNPEFPGGALRGQLSK